MVAHLSWLEQEWDFQRGGVLPKNSEKNQAQSKNWDEDLHNTGTPYFIELSFIVLADIFYKLKFCGNPASSNFIDIIFPTGSDDSGNILVMKYF